MKNTEFKCLKSMAHKHLKSTPYAFQCFQLKSYSVTVIMQAIITMQIHSQIYTSEFLFVEAISEVCGLQ